MKNEFKILTSLNNFWNKKFSEILMNLDVWSSNFCLLDWKTKNSKTKRTYLQISVSNKKIEDFGFLRTPSAQESGITVERLVTKNGNPAEIGQRAYDKETGRLVQIGLTQQIKMLLKTPCASDAYTERLNKKEQRLGNSGTLAQEIQTGFINQRISNLIPTPCSIGMDIHQTAATRNYRGNLEEYIAINFSEKLEKNTTNLLNPNFLAEMMDFPIDWTILPFTKQ